MAIAILQLSDIHFQDHNDVAANFLPLCGNILNATTYNDVDKVIVMVCGDIANSGKLSQFKIAEMRLKQLIENIKIALPKAESVDLIVAPGNHDCNFDHDNELRKIVVSGIPNEKTKLSDSSVISQCLTVQKEYLDFHDRVSTIPPKNNRNDLVIDYVTFVAGKSVCVRTYNTAWVSQIHEEPGKMSFPRYLMNHDSDAEESHDITISVLHHPPHWMLPSRKRLMTQHLEATSDLVLYGHEHLTEEYVKSDFWGELTGVVYGGCFQNPPHDCPGECNVIVIDPHKSCFRFTSYSRSGEVYKEIRRNDNWLPLLRDSKVLGGRFDLREDILHWLSETDADYAHPSGKRLSHDDIFIVPDFLKMADDALSSKNKRSDFLPGKDFENTVLANKKIIVYGEERSGKTAIAKYVLLRLGKAGITPIYFNADGIEARQLAATEQIIQTEFKKMYQDSLVERFEQLGASKKAIVIDDLNKSNLSALGRRKLIEIIASKFDYVIVFGDSAMLIEEISDMVILDSSMDEFTKLKIKELGKYARRQLIRQWYGVGREFGSPAENIPFQIAKAEEVISTLLGKSFIPAYPVIILGFLSTLDQAKPLDHVGSYGYHYEMAITNSLARSQGKIKADIKFRFLAEMAYYMFTRNARRASEIDIKYVYRKYSEEYGIDPGVELLKKELLESKVLCYYDDEYQFKYDYAFYFFIARYLREHMGETTIRDAIRLLCKNMSSSLNANVLLFLAHQTKDQFLLDCMLEIAAGVFPGAEEARLENEIKFVGEIFDSLPKIVVPVGSIEDNVKKSYESQEGNSDEPDYSKLERKEDDDFVRSIDSMIRSSMVLGQILKNFPGSLTLKQKTELIKNAVGSGLRCLGEVLKKIDEGKEDYAKFISARLVEKYPQSDIDEIREKTTASLFWLLEANVFGLMKILSTSIGAPGEDAAFSAVLGELDSNASKMLKVAIDLDTLKIPKTDILKCKDQFRSNLMCLHVLRGLVAHHFYLFPAKESVRNEICDKLNIELGDKERQERALGYRAKRI